MLPKSFLIVIVVLSVFNLVNCEIKTATYNTTTYVICTPNPENNTSNCPKDSQCIDIKGFGSHLKDLKDLKEGLCSCKTEFMVNRKFNPSDNTSVYCIEREDVHTTTTTTTKLPTTAVPVTKAPPTVETSTTTVKPSTVAPAVKSTVAPKVETTTEQHEPKKEEINPEPQKSLFVTLLVPVMIVLAFIGTVFAIRKYDLLDRAHSFIRNRHDQQHQTRYDGLENDFDDDPLLI